MFGFSNFELLEGSASSIAFGFIYYYIKRYTNITHEGVNLTLAWFSAWFISKLIIKLIENNTELFKRRKNKEDFLYNDGYAFLKNMYKMNQNVNPENA